MMDMTVERLLGPTHHTPKHALTVTLNLVDVQIWSGLGKTPSTGRYPKDEDEVVSLIAAALKKQTPKKED